MRDTETGMMLHSARCVAGGDVMWFGSEKSAHYEHIPAFSACHSLFIMLTSLQHAAIHLASHFHMLSIFQHPCFEIPTHPGQHPCCFEMTL